MNDRNRWIDIPVGSKFDAIAIALLALATLILLWPVVFFGELPLDTDTLLFFYPLRALHSDANVGLWNPYLFSGMPRDANPQAQILYPPNFVAALLSPHHAYAFLLASHYLLGGLLLYGLLRALRLAPAAALVGAAVFLLGTFWRCKITNLGLLEGIAWLPGVLLFQWLAIARRSFVPLLASGLLLAMTVLAGVPHTVIYALLMLCIGALAFWRWEGRGVLFTIGVLLIPPLVAFALSAGMIVPAALYAPESVRGSLSLEDALAGAIPLSDIWKVFLGGMSQPEITRADPWEGTVYYGATALLLAAIGWSATPKRLRWALTAMILVGVLFTLGKQGGLYWALYHILPGWNSLNLPNRALLMAALAAPILAGFGAQRLIDAIPLSRIGIVAVSLAAAILFSLWLSATLTDLAPIASFLYATETATFNPDAPPDGLWALLNASLWLSLSLALLLTRQTRFVKPLAALVALAILIAVQSIQYTPRLFLQTTPVVDENGVFSISGWSAAKPLASLRSLLQETPNARVMSYVPAIDASGDVRSRYIVPAMAHRIPEILRIPEIQGYDPLMPQRYVELLRAWAGQSPAANETRIVRLDAAPKPLLDLLGVGWIVGYPDQEILYRGRQVIDQPSAMASMLDQPTEVRSISFRWTMLGAGGAPNAQRLGEVMLLDATDTVRAFPIQAGISIANQFSEYGGDRAAHRPAPVYRWIPIPAPGRYERAQQYLATYEIDPPARIDGVGLQLEAPYLILALMDIAYRRADAAPYLEVERSGPLPIFENPSPIGPVYFSREAIAYNRVEEMIGTIESRSAERSLPVFFHPDDGAVPERAPITDLPTGDISLSLQRDRSDRFTVDIRTPHDGWLAISENYSEYWTATRYSGNGDESGSPQPADIRRANHAFMATQIPAGSHRLVFYYRPKPFYYGCGIAGAALTAIVALLALTRERWLKPARSSLSDDPA